MTTTLPKIPTKDELQAIANNQRRQREERSKAESQKPKCASEFNLEHLAKSVRIKPDERYKETDWIERVEKLTASSNIPKRHNLREEFRCKQWMETLERLKPKIGTGCILALLGPRGTGKTQLAVELMKSAIGRMMSARFCVAMDFFMRIKTTYGKESTESEESMIRKFQSPSLLVIDETQERGETQWEDRLLTNMIDKRYYDMKDTVLISNLIESDFHKSIGSSPSSRLNETGGVVICDWPSFRG